MTNIITAPEEVLKLNLEQLWAGALMLEAKGELSEAQKTDINKVKHGINIKWPIERLIQQWYTAYPENNRVKINGLKEKVDLDTFLQEIQERETILRIIIINTIKEGGITIPNL